MTTVEQLIEQLQKLPKDLPIALNSEYKNSSGYGIKISEVVAHQEQFTTPYCDPGERQKFVVISHIKN